MLYAVLTSTAFTGAYMVPGSREAVAEERQRDVGSVLTMRDTLVRQLSAVRDYMAAQQREGFPASADWSAPSMGPLLQSLTQLDQQLRPFNNGQPVIPITGSTPEQRFQSLNQFLGRDAAAPLDADALRQLEMRVTLAFGLVSSDEAADRLVAVVQGRPAPQPAAGAAVAVAPPAPTEAAPRPAEAAPAPVEAAPEVAAPTSAPALSAEERARYSLMADQLDVIATHGRRQDRTTAGRLRDRIREQLAADTPDIEALQTLERGNRRSRGAARLIDQRYEAAQTAADAARTREERAAHDAAVARANEERSEVDEGAAPLVASDTTELLTSLQGMREQHRDLVNNLTDLLVNSYRLGETARDRLLRPPSETETTGTGLIWRAAESLRLNDVAAARQFYTEANQIYTAQQALYTALLREFVIPAATAAQTTATGVPGIDALQTRMRQRAEEMQQHITSGTLSFFYTWNQYESVWSEYQAMSRLEDLWRTADTLVPSGHPARGEVERALGGVMRALSERGYNPLGNMPQPVVRRLLEDYRRATGNASATRSDLEQALRRNPAYSVQLAVFQLYYQVARAAYEPSADLQTESGQHGLQYHLARLRAARAMFRDEYNQYYYGSWSNLTNRFEDGRSFLDRAVRLARESGMSQTDPLIRYAEARLAMFPNTDDLSEDQQRTVADTFYEMAMNLVAIREAEIWLGDANSQLRGAQVTPARLQRAQAILREARLEFEESYRVITPGTNPHSIADRDVEWDFSTLPEAERTRYAVPPLIYGGQPREISDEALNMVVPTALQALEAYARYDTLSAALQGRLELMEAEGRVEQELTRGADEDEAMMLRMQVAEHADVRAARVSTRDSGLLEASRSEYMHIMMVTGLRDQGAFGVPELNERQQAWADALEALSPELGRATVLAAGRDGIDRVLIDFSYPRLTVDMADFEHQRVAVYPQGHLYGELRRQVYLHTDEAMPALIRHLGVEPQRGTRTTDTTPSMEGVESVRRAMNSITNAYTSGNPEAQMASANEVLISIAEDRLAELRRRLSEQRTTDRIPIQDLARSLDPRSAVVRRAVAIRDRAATRITESRRSIGSDLYEGNVDPSMTIRQLERAIASISDDALIDVIHPPPRPPVTFSARGEARIETDIVHSINMGIATLDIMAQYESEAAVPLRQYERQHGRQTLVYNWTWWVDLGRDDWFLLNPNWDLYAGSGPCNGWVLDPASGMPINPETRMPSNPRTGEAMPGAEAVDIPSQFIARRMEVPDGSGHFAAVRVRAPGRETGAAATTTVEWEPVRVGGQLDILFRLESGVGREGARRASLQPVRADMTDDVVRATCTRTITPESSRPVAGDARATVIVNPR